MSIDISKIVADVVASDGCWCFSRVKDRKVVADIGGSYRHFSQEEFREKRRESLAKISDILRRMDGPTRGKGAMKARKDASREMGAILNLLEPKDVQEWTEEAQPCQPA